MSALGPSGPLVFFIAGGNFCHLLITFANSWTQIRTDILSKVDSVKLHQGGFQVVQLKGNLSKVNVILGHMTLLFYLSLTKTHDNK